jgi:hypothetical protein
MMVTTTMRVAVMVMAVVTMLPGRTLLCGTRFFSECAVSFTVALFIITATINLQISIIQ